MTTHFACNDYQNLNASRRSLLKIGGAGLLGLTMPRLLQAEAKQSATTIRPRAKSVVFLFQFGGPSHLETFDMKPDAPDGIRGLFSPIASNVPGVQVCEHLPRMASVMDKVCLVRSMSHRMKNHNSASYYALSGRAPPVDDIRLKDSLELFPAYGSIVERLAPSKSEMPTFVSHPYVLSDGSRTPGQFASFLGKNCDPLLVTSDPNQRDFRLPELSLPQGLTLDRLESRRELQQVVDRQSRLLDASAKARGLDAYYDSALAMLRSPAVERAFNLSAEPDKVRDRYGRTTYGQSCLLARRLVEAGVKFVNVYFADGIGGKSTTGGGWDTHGFDNTRMFPIIEKYHLPVTDQVLPTFLSDLDERGLLDETLVVWMGEFGRTPKINANISRDHWPNCYTALLAGGGVKRGYVHGASDKNATYPARDPVKPDDLAATMFYLLGIDPQTEVYDASNRPLTIAAGDPVMDLLA
ncbi:MAG TPA: DUF1501 domain-containing protein [Pirellulales bacterium]|jgi:hypothetical protein|nr:DUF1501 domain-containing protein [Pirellulales bacterium]